MCPPRDSFTLSNRDKLLPNNQTKFKVVLCNPGNFKIKINNWITRDKGKLEIILIKVIRLHSSLLFLGERVQGSRHKGPKKD